MVTFPKYQIKRSVNNQFYWVLFAVNGKIILTSSEQYVSKQGCNTSILSSKKNIAYANFKRGKTLGGQFYFLQIAGNYETLGKSEMYESFQSSEDGVESVKRNAPIAAVEDLT